MALHAEINSARARLLSDLARSQSAVASKSAYQHFDTAVAKAVEKEIDARIAKALKVKR